MAAEGVDCERERQAVVVGDGLLFEVDSELVPFVLRHAGEEVFDRRVLEVHGNRAIQKTFKPGFKTHLYAKDLRNVVDDFRIHDIEIVKVTTDAFYEAVTVRIWSEGRDSTIDVTAPSGSNC